MKYLLLILAFIITGCANTQVKELTPEEEKELVKASETIINNIEYIYVDEEDFVKDNDLFTIQVVIVTSEKNVISEDGQVVYTNESSVNDLDTDTLLARYIYYLVEAHK